MWLQPNSMRYLAVDYGEKKTGLAIGDDETKIASPLEVIPGGDDSFSIVQDLVSQEGIDAVVVGVPVAEEGRQPHSLKRIKLFINLLIERLKLPVHEVDERLTSKEAQRLQAEDKTKVPEDALAAMLILQAYFDEMES